jgi:hypothetical protein
MKMPGRVPAAPPVATGDPTIDSVPAESTAMTAIVLDAWLTAIRNLPSGVNAAYGLLPPVGIGVPFGVNTPDGELIIPAPGCPSSRSPSQTSARDVANSVPSTGLYAARD